MPFPPDEAKLVSIFIQTLLYGAYVVVFGLTMWILLTRRAQKEEVNRTMLFISITMFTFATMHIGVNYTRVIRAFIFYKDQPGGTAGYFNQLSEFTQIFGSTIYVAQTLVGDAVVLYRCYIVYGRNIAVVAFPLLLLMGSTACGIGILYSFAKVGEAEIFVVQLKHWILSFFSLTLATNLICTILVAARIYYVNKLFESFNMMSTSLRPIALLVIESGMVYSATLMTLLILYQTESWFQYVLLDAVSPIVGLVFSMIIVRIGLGITTASGQTRAAAAAAPNSTIRFGSTSNTHQADSEATGDNKHAIRLGLRVRRDEGGSSALASSGVGSSAVGSVKASEEV
ncbi:hypothetical protein MKEN_00865100 [Mycena kentingensis (nom. inval.)]|nr:hypothetical protein MKEN_00865100 [Mycena kentingensis (nom. inval.)]